MYGKLMVIGGLLVAAGVAVGMLAKTSISFNKSVDMTGCGDDDDDIEYDDGEDCCDECEDYEEDFDGGEPDDDGEIEDDPDFCMTAAEAEKAVATAKEKSKNRKKRGSGK